MRLLTASWIGSALLGAAALGGGAARAHALKRREQRGRRHLRRCPPGVRPRSCGLGLDGLLLLFRALQVFVFCLETHDLHLKLARLHLLDALELKFKLHRLAVQIVTLPPQFLPIHFGGAQLLGVGLDQLLVALELLIPLLQPLLHRVDLGLGVVELLGDALGRLLQLRELLLLRVCHYPLRLRLLHLRAQLDQLLLDLLALRFQLDLLSLPLSQQLLHRRLVLALVRVHVALVDVLRDHRLHELLLVGDLLLEVRQLFPVPLLLLL
mmetsp:Transcript_49551/g.117874  ORF Transcript_49551/g.117874 Transcript_49551/m.117874 type:complete len:267 (-) Transcript_49551:3996-4796(-)